MNNKKASEDFASMNDSLRVIIGKQIQQPLFKKRCCQRVFRVLLSNSNSCLTLLVTVLANFLILLKLPLSHRILE